LKSDNPTDFLYPDERADIYQELKECGGREAPEVDHIDPSYQSGSNSYINARLVSFLHNHLYREKKTDGSMAVNQQMLAMYQAGKVAFIGNTLGGKYVTKYYETGVEKQGTQHDGPFTLTFASDRCIQGTQTPQKYFDGWLRDDDLFDA